jgi:Transposase DDE domain
LFGTFIPESLLESTDSGRESRNRTFNRRTTFWAFLTQVLSPSGSCRLALRKLQAWQSANDLRVADSNTSAYCQARNRMDLENLMEVHRRAAQNVLRKNVRSEHEFGRPVKIVDGTTYSMPDTPDHQREWPQTKAQKPGCGFPFVKVVGLFTLAEGVLTEWVEGNKHHHEMVLFRKLWGGLVSGDVLLADTAFGSFAAIASLLKQGVDSVMHGHQARKVDFRKGKRLGKKDHLVAWTKPLQPNKGWSLKDWKALPETITVREVEIRVEVPGFRVDSYVLVTTLLDPLHWPAETLGRMYFKRWAVEVFFRDIKTAMGMEVLRCMSPEMIRKEIIMQAIAYNCIRGVMQQVSLLYEVPLERISFTGTCDTIRSWREAIALHLDKPRKLVQVMDDLYRVIAEDPLPHRPERSEPRVKKRRPKGYQLMTKPRHEMRVSASRRDK